MERNDFVLWFKDIGKEDIPLVGGKCANLGELLGKIGVPVPNGLRSRRVHTNFSWKKRGRIGKSKDSSRG